MIATGWCDQPHVPPLADRPAIRRAQITPNDYRSPDDLPAGRVLVVGASATGVQLADELARAGREVVLAVGGHSRVPRRYRGMDIWWWLDRIGTFARTIDEVADPARARERRARCSSSAATTTATSTCPRSSASACASPAGWPASTATASRFAADLRPSTAAADERLTRLLARIDDHITRSGLDAEVLARRRPTAVRPDGRR